MKKIVLSLLSLVTLTSCSFLESFLPSGWLPSEDPTSSEPSKDKPTTNPTIDPTSDLTINPTEEPTSNLTENPTSIPSTSNEDTYTLDIYTTQGGSYSGATSGKYTKDTRLTITATPDSGFLFDGFYIDNVIVEYGLTYSFVMNRDINLEIRFVDDSSDAYSYQAYSHVLKSTDIPNTSGGTTAEINGLKWTYTSHIYKQDSTKGVQIGSSNRPQTTAFELSAKLPEGCKITSAYVEVAVASGGKSTFDIKFSGKRYYGEDFSKTDIELFSYEDLDIEANAIGFAFKSQMKALYIYSFGFSVKVPKGANLNLSGDTDIEVDPIVPGQNGIPNLNYQPISKENYYKGLDTTLTGNKLLKTLRTHISEMTNTSYDQAKYMLQYTDENPEKEGYLYGMYDGDNIVAEWMAGSTWNREHVWPCAKMALEDEIRPSGSTRNHASDLHNLRAACPTVNGYHSDKFYSNTNTSTTMFPNVTSGIDGKHAFTGDFRGDVARIMFYMYTRYEGLELTDNLTSADNTSMGELSLFIEWNQLDPVDNFEIQRNDRIYCYQGNRNPFIDYPNLVDNLFN